MKRWQYALGWRIKNEVAKQLVIQNAPSRQTYPMPSALIIGGLSEARLIEVAVQPTCCKLRCAYIGLTVPARSSLMPKTLLALVYAMVSALPD